MPIFSNLIARLSVDHTAFDRGIGNSRRSLRDLAGETARTNAAFLGLAKSGLAIAGVAVSFETLRRGIAGGIRAARDAEKTQRFFEIALGDSAAAAQDWVDKYTRALGTGDDETKRLLGSFQMLTEGLGAAAPEALTISEMMTRLTNDMASFARIKPEEAFAKIQGALEGNYRGLRDLNIKMSEATITEYALREGWIKEGQELSELQTLYATINVLLDKTPKMQGDLARSTDTLADAERRLHEEWKKTSQRLGEELLPAYKTGVGLLHDFVRGLRAITDEAEKASGAVKRLISGIGEGGSVAGFGVGATAALRRGPMGPNLGLDEGPQVLSPPGEYATQEEMMRWGNMWADAGRINAQLREQARLANPGGARDSRERTRELKRFNESVAEEIRNIQFEAETLRMTNAERERAVALHNLQNQAIRAGTTLSSGQQELLRQELDLLQQQQRVAEINGILASGSVGGLREMSRALMEGRDASEALRSSLLRLVDALQEALVWKPLEEGLFKMLSGGRGGGWLGGGAATGMLGGILNAGIAASATAGIAQFGSNIGVSVASQMPLVFHAGGRIGVDAAPRRALPASLFALAPRLHGGLAADEYPAVLQRGERVTSAPQVAREGQASAEMIGLLRRIAAKDTRPVVYMVHSEEEVLQIMGGRKGREKILETSQRYG